MTTQRKWRFFILIGAGLIAAGAVIYYSNGRVSNDKTQGAIGNRDVYRDATVASADVATPGSAPVATEAILKSSEFKALAKDPAFLALLNDNDFSKLTHVQGFLALLANADFQRQIQDIQFRQLVQSSVFGKALEQQLKNYDRLALTNNLARPLTTTVEGLQAIKSDRLSAFLQLDEHYTRLADKASFDSLMDRYIRLFATLHSEKSFDGLLDRASLQAVLQNKVFADLVGHQDFRAALMDGNASRLVAENGRK